ncbi:Substance-K receptor [Amphibalanus amphitrite]|uniref:Substance-K receptor n=1 Tax=Amphibalanus amphitrite TaxID=1232801 RepID=A0A6A4WZ82_AMPAM|nr:Substance-K receptor [Amphibalanus amphitrite]
MSPGSEELLDCGNMTDVNNTYGNTTNSTCGGDFNQFIMPWWRQVVWTLIYIALVIVATGGNLIVIWIVLAHKQVRDDVGGNGIVLNPTQMRITERAFSIRG